MKDENTKKITRRQNKSNTVNFRIMLSSFVGFMASLANR